MNYGSIIDALRSSGRGTDSELAHVTPGEIVVPVEVQTPELIREIAKALKSRGADISEFTVGGPGTNPATGLPEFGWFDKVLDVIAPVLGGAIGGAVAPSLDIGTELGAAIGAGAGSLVSGGSPTEALLAGAGTYLGGKYLAPELGLDGTFLGQNTGTLAGQAIGGAAGQMLGSHLTPEPPKVPQLGQSNINTQLPSLPGAPNVVNPNLNQMPIGSVLPNGQSLTQPIPAGIRYLMSVTDRDTGEQRLIETPFSTSLGYSRRGGWGDVTYV